MRINLNIVHYIFKNWEQESRFYAGLRRSNPPELSNSGTHGHYKAEDVAMGLNSIIRGWLNYFSIPGVSYPAMSKRRLRAYLSTRLYRYFNRKSQRKSRLYRQKAFEVLVTKFGLIDPTKYVYSPVRL